METKYIFLDIDGTLVDFQGKLADSALEALKAAKANGHKLFVCTGRQRSQIYPWLLEKITFDGAVCSSGAYVMADGECMARHCFSKEYMAFLARYFTSLHAPYCVQTEHTLMLEKWCADAIVAHYLADGIDRGKINSLFGMTTVVESASELTSAEKLIYYGAPKGLGGCRRPRGALRRRALQLRQHGRPLRRGYGQQIHKGHRNGGDTAPLRCSKERDDSLRRR